jgi:ribA/ribD-fused uncharacterized protein
MISSFTGNFEFLSNFWPSTVEFEGMSFPTVENAYQAAKSENPLERILFMNMQPGQAKRFGRKLPVLRPNWEEVKEAVMFDLLRQKFEQPHLRLKLKATGAQSLIEGNWWHDNYWGSCRCIEHKGRVGQNRLGFLLMKLRDAL